MQCGSWQRRAGESLTTLPTGSPLHVPRPLGPIDSVVARNARPNRVDSVAQPGDGRSLTAAGTRDSSLIRPELAVEDLRVDSIVPCASSPCGVQMTGSRAQGNADLGTCIASHDLLLSPTHSIVG